MNILKRFLPRKHNCGSIFIFTVWVLVFFSILTVAIYKIVSSQLRIAKRLQQRVISQYLAKAAVVYAQHERNSDGTVYDTLYELKHKRRRELGNGAFVYSIVDEESKININVASQKILSNFEQLNKELAEEIVKSPLRPFHVKEELLLVEGMEEEIFEGVKDYITVYGKGTVNINSATDEVLKALGMDIGLIEMIKNYRRGYDGEEGTEDDRFFESKDTILEQLREFSGLFMEQQTVLIQLIDSDFLGVCAENFTLLIETEVFGRPVLQYVIVIDGQKIKQWREL